MQKITPFLWFDKNAEEAVQFYASVFKNSKVGHISRYDKVSAEVSGRKAGTAMTVSFELEGQEFTAINGGPGVFELTGAISFVIDYEDQAEVDHYWEKLSADPASEQCGWIKDKYGVTWQVVPKQLGELLSDPDPEKAGRVMQAMLTMKKIVIADLKKAYEG